MLHTIAIASVVLGLCGNGLGDQLTISTAEGFVDLYNGVKNGTDYKDTTVLLDSDLDFTPSVLARFNTIGDYSSYFLGTIDGQGHTISNLVLESSSQDYFGMFAYSEGIVVRNLVLDATCAVTSTLSTASSYYTYVGGLIGKCFSYKYKPCTFENDVSMASVTFAGNMSRNGKYKYMYLGGLAGELSSSGSYDVVVNNCANYGHVACTGVSGTLYIGGIVGRSYGQSIGKNFYIQNSFNYGTITFTGASLAAATYIGGIAGFGTNNDIENCLSAGKIEIEANETGGHIGSVTGDASAIDITHCFWTEDVGYGAEYDSRTHVANSTVVTLNSTVLEELNEYAGAETPWLMLHLNGGSINGLEQEAILVTQKDFPEPVREGHALAGWYEDAELTKRFDPKTQPLTGITDLYAGWTTTAYTVTFDFGNGTIVNASFLFEAPIEYPEDVEMEGYEFVAWDCNLTEMPAHDLYVKAIWTINGYMLTFDFGNGTNVSYVLQYDDVVKYPHDVPVKEGYTFNGWDKEIERMPAENVTITAKWLVKYFALRFDFANGTTLKSDVAFGEKIDYPTDVRKVGHSFVAWDPRPETMPARDTTIVAVWSVNSYAVTFDLGNGTKICSVFEYNSTVVYPEDVAKEGHTLRWSSDVALMPAENITIVALWDINSYLVRFDLGNETVIEETFVFNSSIRYPENVERPGYDFEKWDPSPETMPARDLNITAKWKQISSYVRIVLSKAMSQEEAVGVFTKFTDDYFGVVYFEVDEEFETSLVIIRFEDIARSEKFIANVLEKKAPEDAIESIAHITDYKPSYSYIVSPLSLLSFLMI